MGIKQQNMLSTFKIIEKHVVLLRSQSHDIPLEAHKKDRRASIAPASRPPNLEELLRKKTFIRGNSLNPQIAM